MGEQDFGVETCVCVFLNKVTTLRSPNERKKERIPLPLLSAAPYLLLQQQVSVPADGAVHPPTLLSSLAPVPPPL